MKRNEFGFYFNDLGLKDYGVEIGTHQGIFADTLLSTWNGQRLYCVDPWINNYGDIIDDNNRPKDYRKAVDLLKRYGTRAHIVKLYSHEVVIHFRDQSLDFVYIDGNHAKEYVTLDIELWWPKIKPRGVLAGHDYDHTSFEVHSVVDSFCCDNDLELQLTHDDYPNSWWVLKPPNVHQDNVVLDKPAY